MYKNSLRPTTYIKYILMKQLFIILIIVLALFFPSCDYDLDINTSPNTPQTAAPELRLPSILSYSLDIYGSHGIRTAVLCQQMGYNYSSGSRYYELENWHFLNNADTYVWQSWYIYTWVNIKKMIEDAQSGGAYHYVGVGKILQAFGCGYVVDAYGIMAYEQALSDETFQPDYDDAEYVYSQILPLCDEAISYLKMAQTESAPDLAEGDIIYSGNVEKWIKFAYGVKARLMSHLSKKSEGTDLLDYNPDEILTLLSSSFESNDDDFVLNYVDSDISVQNAIQYQNTSASHKPGKLWIEYLLNKVPGTGNSWNSSVEDPRAAKLIPKIISGDNTGQYSYGVDLTLSNSEPKSSDVNYVGLKSTDKNLLYYTQKASPYFLLTYSEIKFIEAEVQFRKGEKEAALTAYKEAIAANIDRLGCETADRDLFLSSNAVAQSVDELTLSHIMIQKYIALTYNPEVWTDMRRCDFCTDATGVYNEEVGVYKGFNRPSFVYSLNFPTEKDYVRRYQMAYMERDYNSTKVAEWGVFDDTYMTTPVWWDTEE